MAYVRTSARLRRNLSRGRGLGTVSAQVGRSMIYGSDAVSARNNLRYPVRYPGGLPIRSWPVMMPPYPSYPTWGANPPRWTGGNGGPTGILTPALPGTIPAADAGLVNASGAMDPATGISYASELAAAQGAGATPTAASTASSSVLGVDASGTTTIFGVPWYFVAGGGALAFYMMSGRRGR